MTLSLKRHPVVPKVKTALQKPDDLLPELGFRAVAANRFSKRYSSPQATLNILVDVDGCQLTAISAELEVKDAKSLDKVLRLSDSAVRRNAAVIMSFSSMGKFAQIGGEAGNGGLHNVNLPMDYPGPRWWPMSVEEKDQQELQNKTTDQTRYNPQYMPVGEAAGVPGQQAGDYFVPYPLSAARIVPDRQQSYLEYTTTDGRRGRMKLEESGQLGDMSEEANKYKVQMQQRPDGTLVSIRKDDSRGDNKGIWEINGRPAGPGFAYIDEDARTSYSLHPELLFDHDWASGGWSPGRHNY